MAATYPFKRTLAKRLVLTVLLADPVRELYGREICVRTGLPSGTVYPILASLDEAGWTRSRWERVNPARVGRPRRRLYRLVRKTIPQVWDYVR